MHSAWGMQQHKGAHLVTDDVMREVFQIEIILVVVERLCERSVVVCGTQEGSGKGGERDEKEGHCGRAGWLGRAVG
jgi:hypothetical protein